MLTRLRKSYWLVVVGRRHALPKRELLRLFPQPGRHAGKRGNAAAV